MSVHLLAHAVKDKWLELSTPNSLEIQSMTGAQHALTLSQKSRFMVTSRVGLHVDMTA